VWINCGGPEALAVPDTSSSGTSGNVANVPNASESGTTGDTATASLGASANATVKRVDVKQPT
jgi:hypothetical protein